MGRDSVISNKILLGILDEFKKDFGIKSQGEAKIFENLVNYVTLSKIDPESFSDAAIFDSIDVDKNSTFGIDAFALFINDNLITKVAEIEHHRITKRMDIKFVFIQTKRSTSIDTGDFLKFTAAIKNFFSQHPTISLSEELKSAKTLVDELFKPENARIFSSRKPTCEIYYATSGSQSQSTDLDGLIKSEESALKMAIPEINSFTIKQIGADYIIDSYNEIENRFNVIVDFEKNIPCSTINDVEQSYIGYLPVNEFLKLITGADGNIRKNLFYENVRDFQGKENAVNTEIRKTLENKELIDQFLLLNNGITIVARDFSNLRSNQYELSDYYIVNGCQTSNVIYSCRDQIENKEKLNIPVKIIHTTSNDLISRLIRSTNRQTPVPDEAFVSLEKFHKRLQDFYRLYSDSAPERLYYERRSKEFSNSETRVERPRIVNLHAQIRSFTSVVLGEPQLVMTNNPNFILRNNPKRLFVEDHKHIAYYLSSLLLYLFYRQKEDHKIASKYVSSRYWICWIALSLEFKKTSIHHLNSPKTESNIESLIQKLGEISFQDNFFRNAINYFNAAKKIHDADFGKKTNNELIGLRSFRDIVKNNLELKFHQRKT